MSTPIVSGPGAPLQNAPANRPRFTQGLLSGDGDTNPLPVKQEENRVVGNDSSPANPLQPSGPLNTNSNTTNPGLSNRTKSSTGSTFGQALKNKLKSDRMGAALSAGIPTMVCGGIGFAIGSFVLPGVGSLVGLTVGLALAGILTGGGAYVARTWCDHKDAAAHELPRSVSPPTVTPGGPKQPRSGASAQVTINQTDKQERLQQQQIEINDLRTTLNRLLSNPKNTVPPEYRTTLARIESLDDPDEREPLLSGFGGAMRIQEGIDKPDITSRDQSQTLDQKEDSTKSPKVRKHPTTTLHLRCDFSTAFIFPAATRRSATRYSQWF